MERPSVVLGGRTFTRLEDGTVEHDFWMMAQIREAGLHAIEFEPGSDVGEVVEELLGRCLASGKAILLLSGLLLPEGMAPEEWEPEVAQDIAAHIGKITAADEKAKLKPLIASMLIGFFKTGLASLKTSLKSSSQGAGVEPESAGIAGA